MEARPSEVLPASLRRGQVTAWARTIGRALARALGALLESLERARQRRRLSALDDRMLKDIGLSRADVEGERRRPCWRD